MTTVNNLSRYVRTKNASPFWVTVDIFAKDANSYRKLKASSVINQETIAQIYRIDPKLVNIYYLPNLNVIKVSFPRPHVQGYKYESDMHFGQQYVPLLNIEV